MSLSSDLNVNLKFQVNQEVVYCNQMDHHVVFVQFCLMKRCAFCWYSLTNTERVIRLLVVKTLNIQDRLQGQFHAASIWQSTTNICMSSLNEPYRFMIPFVNVSMLFIRCTNVCDQEWFANFSQRCFPIV